MISDTVRFLTVAMDYLLQTDMCDFLGMGSSYLVLQATMQLFYRERVYMGAIMAANLWQVQQTCGSLVLFLAVTNPRGFLTVQKREFI